MKGFIDVTDLTGSASLPEVWRGKKSQVVKRAGGREKVIICRDSPKLRVSSTKEGVSTPL
jgi:hypothetical protein